MTTKTHPPKTIVRAARESARNAAAIPSSTLAVGIQAIGDEADTSHRG